MYWLGPFLGGVFGGVAYDLLFAANSTCEKAKALVTERDYQDSQFDELGRRRTAAGALNDGNHLTDEESVQQGYGTLH